METQMNVLRAKIVSGGRLQLSAELRRKYNIKDGDEVLLEEKENGIVLRTQHQSVRRVQEIFRKYFPKEGEMSLSDELIADRRLEVQREEEEEAQWRKRR
jgi:bifunctional DNA-binding transcriptional regulator/antitoxin component of YhaV-PrlF toxin-antitoxin module